MQISLGRVDIDRMGNEFGGRKCHLTFSCCAIRVRQDFEWLDDPKDQPVTPHTNVMSRGSKLEKQIYISLLLASNYCYSLVIGAGQTNRHVLSIKLNVSGVFRDRLMNCRISWKVQSKPSDYGRVCNISVSVSGLGLKHSRVYHQCCFRKP